MKLKIIILLLFSGTIFYAQVAENSWNLSFGGTYPRLMSINPESNSLENNYGAFFGIERKFNERVGLRLRFGYSQMKSEYSRLNIAEEQNVDVFSGNLDLSYDLLPCKKVSPYLVLGIGGLIYDSENSPIAKYDERNESFQVNMGVGVDWSLVQNLSLITEFIYHTPSSNELDGINDELSDKGIFGGSADTYMSFDVGLKWFFKRGPESTLCDDFHGLSAVPKIDTVIQYKTKEVIKEVKVEKPVEVVKKEWVLVGINFDFDKHDIKLEAKPILQFALDFFKEHDDVKFEIQGHTDSLGTDEYNKKLSLLRAEIVRDYLARQGISKDRMTVKGFGESMPVADNSSKEGRFFNRRIVFKVVDHLAEK